MGKSRGCPILLRQTTIKWGKMVDKVIVLCYNMGVNKTKVGKKYAN